MTNLTATFQQSFVKLQILICDSGSVLTMTDSKNNMKVLDVTHGRLRKINTFGIPLFKQLSWDGAYLAYLSSVETQVVCQTAVEPGYLSSGQEFMRSLVYLRAKANHQSQTLKVFFK